MKIIILVNKENDDPLWPIFQAYYSKHVDEIETIKLRENNPKYAPGAFAREVSIRQAELLETFDAVVYADIDEFIMPDPNKYKGLRDYIEKNAGALPRTNGFHIVHNGEDEIDLSKPLLQQRKQWSFDKLYCKRLITYAPVSWAPGFHHLNGKSNPEPDRDLILAHVLYIDDKLALERLKVTYPHRSITQVRERIEAFELSVIPERYKIV